MTPVIRPNAAAPQFKNMLIERLPVIRGRLTPNAPLGHMTWFGVGGPAEVLYKPADREDLAEFIAHCPQDIPVMVMGVASNLIIRDGGIPGVVIRLGREFAHIDTEGTNIRAGAAAMDMNLALHAAKGAVAGLEFFSGIPGTIGGALRMNAGAYGGETKDALIAADVLYRDGTIRRMSPSDMDMRYRHNALPSDVIFLSGLFRGASGNTSDIELKIAEIKRKRSETQPIKTRTGGSTFANPEQGKAWELIDKAGCRGLKIGDAQMSDMHCNFMINTQRATAAQLERLGEEVRKRVYETSGVMLRWEIKRVGVPLEKDPDIAELVKKEGTAHG